MSVDCAEVQSANDAPAWMHALVNVPLPEHDEKTDAVMLYSEHIFTVQPNGKIKDTERAAYKILRVGGKRYGISGGRFRRGHADYGAAWMVYPGARQGL